MPEFGGVGKFLLVVGGILALIGLLITLWDKLSGPEGGLGWLGKLPGDILIKRDHATFYFPFTTSLLLSLVLSLVLYLLFRR